MSSNKAGRSRRMASQNCLETRIVGALESRLKREKALALSFVQGSCDTPLIFDTVGGVFDATARQFADREALIVPHQGVHWNYRELQSKVDAFARALGLIGLEPGDRLGI